MSALPHELYPSFEAGAEGSGNPGCPSGGPAEDYLRHVCETLGTNWRFLNLNEDAREVLREIADLLNEGITEYLGLVLNWPNRGEESVRRAMFYFVIHALLPMSSALWLNALSGNLPACFVEARIIPESLAKCYLADLKHSDKATFWERIEALEEERRKSRSISEMMREVDRDLGVQMNDGELMAKSLRTLGACGGDHAPDCKGGGGKRKATLLGSDYSCGAYGERSGRLEGAEANSSRAQGGVKSGDEEVCPTVSE